MIEPWHWMAFAALVIGMLGLDLGVINRHSRESTLREAGIWTAVWVMVALSFNTVIWFWLGNDAGSEFLQGYLVEWSLSMDNVFVFAVIFSFFRVPMRYQHRVLFWGIIGAVVMRLVFIIVGNQLLAMFSWLLPLLGLILIYTGVKLGMHSDSEVHPDKNILLRLARRLLPVAREDHGEKFIVREAGRLCVTPLFLVLLVVESTDVVFAVDSVPAIFGLVNPKADYFMFVVFTSNLFAILGLRALYFLLAGMMGMFRYLSYGLSAILVFVGGKMVFEYLAHTYHWIEPGEKLLPSWASLAVIIGCLAIAIVASIMAAGRATPASEEAGTSESH